MKKVQRLFWLTAGCTALVFLGCVGRAKSNAAQPANAPHSKAEAMQYPKTPKIPVRVTYHGQELVDEFRWLENSTQENVRQWLNRQDRFTRTTLDGLGGSLRLRKELAATTDQTVRIRDVSARGQQVFFLMRAPGAERDSLYVTQRGEDDARLVLAPTEDRSRQGTETIDYYVPSPSGSRIAVGMSRGGREDATLRVYDITAQQWLPDQLPNVMLGNIWWLNESSFTYWRPNFATPGDPAGRWSDTNTYLHYLGNIEQDPVVFGRAMPGVEIDGLSLPAVYISSGAPERSFGFAQGGENEYEIFVVDTADLALGQPSWRLVVKKKARVGDFEVRGSKLYLLSYANAPRGQILTLDVATQTLASDVVVPQSELVLRSLHMARDGLYITALEGNMLRALKYLFDEKRVRPLPLEPDQWVDELVADPRQDGVVILTSSWMRSPRLLQYNPKTDEVIDTRLLKPSSLEDFDFVVTSLEVPGEGNVNIPLTLIHRKGIERNGRNPTKLRAYGSYGYVLQPYFLELERPWLRRGGIFAYAHVRGNGTLGDDWHQAARRKNKLVAVRDYIRCAEYLIENGYTSPSRLAARGGSAGGVVVGSAVMSRPELFRAAVIHAGVVHILRLLEKIPAGWREAEFGSPDNAGEFETLKQLDAYYSVEGGREYPSLLLTVGENDPRAPIWQAAKLAVKLQTVAGSEVFLRVYSDYGHWLRTTEYAIERTADEDAFLWWKFGRKEFQPKHRAPP